MPMPKNLAALLPLTLVLCGCGMLNAELEAKTVCPTIVDHQFPGADQSGVLDEVITYDLGADVPVLSDSGASYDLKLQSLALTLGSDSGLTDLSGLDAAQVSVLSPPAASLDEPTLVSYARGADPHPTRIVIASPTNLDLQPYLQDGVVRLRARASGTLPTQPWRATMTACFTLKVKVDAGDL
jgi:hypothetical protein